MTNKANDPFEPYALVPESSLNEPPRFSDELISKKGKILEFYIGDQAETLNYNDYSVPRNCVIYGKLLEVFDRFIKIECYYVDMVSKKVSKSSPIYINAFQIRAMTELDGVGTLDDIFLSASSSAKVRKTLRAHGIVND